jgi:hypothetical protein
MCRIDSGCPTTISIVKAMVSSTAERSDFSRMTRRVANRTSGRMAQALPTGQAMKKASMPLNM